jgi:hypothetical protein
MMPLPNNATTETIIHNPWRLAAACSALLVLSAVLYASPRWQFFRTDDLVWIRALQPKSFWRLLWEQFAQGAPQDYRPLMSICLFLLHRIFGDWAPAFYAVNLIVHAANAALVYRVAARFGLSELWGFIAAVLFAVHPAPYQTVLWINDGALLLQVHFTLWAVWFLFRYLDTSLWRFYAASAGAATGAMFMKESGVVTVVLLPILDLIFRPRFSLTRLKPYFLLLPILVVYLWLALSFVPGWREHPDVYRFGAHVLPNTAFTVGFLINTPHGSMSPTFFPTTVLGGLFLLAAFWAFRDHRSGAFITLWLILGSFPTALFVRPDGFASTGRYTYSILAPFVFAVAALFQELYVVIRRIKSRLSATLVLIAVALLVSASFKTSRLAVTPYESQHGPILYHYVVLDLMDYREAERFLKFEAGCPSERQVEEAITWANKLIQGRDSEPHWQLPGFLIRGVGRAMLRQPLEAADEFKQAIDIIQRPGKLELVRGAEVAPARVREIAALWLSSPPLTVCHPSSAK